MHPNAKGAVCLVEGHIGSFVEDPQRGWCLRCFKKICLDGIHAVEDCQGTNCKYCGRRLEQADKERLAEHLAESLKTLTTWMRKKLDE